jgi:hypothetical protein
MIEKKRKEKKHKAHFLLKKNQCRMMKLAKKISKEKIMSTHINFSNL